MPYNWIPNPEYNWLWMEMYIYPGSLISVPNFKRIVLSQFNWTKIIAFPFNAALTFADLCPLNPALLHYCKVKPWTINDFSLYRGATIKHFFSLNVIIKCVKNLSGALLACKEGFLSTSNYVGTHLQMSQRASQNHSLILMLQ